jgi:hypothetical protein
MFYILLKEHKSSKKSEATCDNVQPLVGVLTAGLNRAFYTVV